MSEPKGIFVTGTDTDVGKTVVSLGLMQALQDRGLTVAGMKPVAAGCGQTAAGLRNDDAVRLQQQSSIALEYTAVNPYAFEPAIAPHLAARAAGVTVDFDVILTAYRAIAARVDCVVVEGAGGWRVPLNERASIADLAAALGLDVCLVVGMRLGCLNHALLSAASIEAAGCRLAGWVANCLPADMEYIEENINTLKDMVSSPLMGTVPSLATVAAGAVARCLDVRALARAWGTG